MVPEKIGIIQQYRNYYSKKEENAMSGYIREARKS
jgi:hypothetical protein